MLEWLKKHLIPHRDNNHKPHLLRERSLVAIILIVFLIEAVFLFQLFVVFKKTDFLAQVLPSVLVSLTNQSRQENNLSKLSVNPLLEEAARLKAEDMAMKGYFAHTSPEGVTPWHWLSQVGYKYSSAGENLAVNFFDSSDVARAWMNSPSHRDNIVNSRYSEIGIATAQGIYKGRSTVFVVQFFGNPAPGSGTLAISGVEEEVEPAQVAVLPPQSVVEPLPPQAPQTTQPSQQGVLSSESEEKKEDQAQELEEKSLDEKIIDEEIEDDVLVLDNRIFFSGLTQPQAFTETMNRAAVSPRATTNIIFITISLIIFLAALLAIFIKIEVQHPYMLFSAFATVIIITGILAMNSLTFGSYAVELPTDNNNASVIGAF